jgi:TolB-like protein/tetratricopeptide (TPR) repeat protein
MFRVAGLYIVGSWIIIEVSSVFFPAWGIPDTALRYLIIAAALCFPIALVFGWIFDITKDGIVRTRKAGRDEEVEASLQRQDYLILAAFLALGGFILFGSAEKVIEEIENGPETVAAVVRPDNSIAVLPFVNLDTNPETGYFSDGVTEEILHRLSSLKILQVLARTSSFAMKHSEQGPAEISQLLGVRYLLHGSVRRDNNLVRVTARLIDDSGYQVWSASFDRELESIFVIQTEIATKVASEIINEIVPFSARPSARTTANMDAYNAYLIGRAYLNSRVPGWREQAETAFHRAIEFDDQYAPPYAGLAVTISVNTNPDQETFDAAWHLAETSVRLDPELAEGHAAMGLLSFFPHRRDLEASESHLRFAIELDPSLSIAYGWLAIALQRQGRFPEVAEVENRGLAIDPLNPILVSRTASRYSEASDFNRAEQLLLRLTHIPEPSNIAYAELGGLYGEFGRIDRLIEIEKEGFRASYRSGDGDHLSSLLGLAGSYYQLGMIAEGDDYLDIATAPMTDSFEQFMERGFTLKYAGRVGELRKLLEKSLSDPELGIEQQPEWVMVDIGHLQIAVGHYEAGIESMEIPFDVMSLEIFNYNVPDVSINIMQILAYAYSEVGRSDESRQLLTALQPILDDLSDSGYAIPSHFARYALNRSLLGDEDGARQNFETAVDAGFRDYYGIINDPVWADTLELSGFSDLLDEMKQDLDRQRALVELEDAEDGFRAEVEKLFPL